MILGKVEHASDLGGREENKVFEEECEKKNEEEVEEKRDELAK